MCMYVYLCRCVYVCVCLCMSVYVCIISKYVILHVILLGGRMMIGFVGLVAGFLNVSQHFKHKCMGGRLMPPEPIVP